MANKMGGNHRALTAEQLRGMMNYDPSTGIFTWLKRCDEGRLDRTWNTRYAGAACGTPHSHGYTVIRVLGRAYLAHRLAWLYMTGAWPSGGIDHRNLAKSDNRFPNLRPATDSQNHANVPTRAHNKSGFKGVQKRKGRWVAFISKNRKQHYLGAFGRPEDAHAAYCEAARETYGEFARFA